MFGRESAVASLFRQYKAEKEAPSGSDTTDTGVSPLPFLSPDGKTSGSRYGHSGDAADDGDGGGGDSGGGDGGGD